MSTNNIENETNNRTNGEENQQIVIQSQPKTGETQQKSKMSSTEELALLGLRPNSENPDPCLCICCMFTAEVLLTPMGGFPLIFPHKREENKSPGNWDNHSNDGENDHNDEEGMEWVITMASLITGNISDGNNSDSGDSSGSGGQDEEDGDDNGGGGDGD